MGVAGSSSTRYSSVAKARSFPAPVVRPLAAGSPRLLAKVPVVPYGTWVMTVDASPPT